jgi:acetyl esterase/lipase
MPWITRLLGHVAGLLLAAGAWAQPPKALVPENTPTGFPGAETFVYRELQPEPVRIHVFKPQDWKAGDRRPAVIWFFGGGWTTGTPANSIGWGKWAATCGWIGIAPDYRTNGRWGTTPLASVADGRAALRWVQDHAVALGVDPKLIVVGGNSAGSHVALWTAIMHSPPGSDAREAPTFKPAALLLTSVISDTTKERGYTPRRFGENATALSPIDQLDATMPPMLVIHGEADALVPVRQSIALRDKLVATGNVIEFIAVPHGGHNFSGEIPEWKANIGQVFARFLAEHGVRPGTASRRINSPG